MTKYEDVLQSSFGTECGETCTVADAYEWVKGTMSDLISFDLTCAGYIFNPEKKLSPKRMDPE